MLSKGMITGVDKKKKKKKNMKKKKEILVGTIGLPVFFSRFIYNTKKTNILPFKFLMADDVRKKMGKKKKKKKK